MTQRRANLFSPTAIYTLSKRVSTLHAKQVLVKGNEKKNETRRTIVVPCFNLLSHRDPTISQAIAGHHNVMMSTIRWCEMTICLAKEGSKKRRTKKNIKTHHRKVCQLVSKCRWKSKVVETDPEAQSRAHIHKLLPFRVWCCPAWRLRQREMANRDTRS